MANTISGQRQVSVGTGPTAFLPAKRNRTALIISAPQTNRFTLSITPTATLDQGLTVYPGTLPLVLTRAEHGDLVARAWTAITAGAQAQTVNVLETLEE